MTTRMLAIDPMLLPLTRSPRLSFSACVGWGLLGCWGAPQQTLIKTCCAWCWGQGEHSQLTFLEHCQVQALAQLLHQPRREVLLLFPLCRCGNCSTQRVWTFLRSQGQGEWWSQTP